MSGTTMQSEVDEIFNDPTEINKKRPRAVFELPGHIVLMIKRNNMLLEKMGSHVEFGLKSPWLPSSQAAKYLGVSKSHLLHNLKDKIPYSKSEEGQIIVFHINDLDEYWKARRRN